MKRYSGIAIAVAWPDTLCKQAGAWYDLPLRWLGINKNYYYKVGHAAVVLVDIQTSICHYFDFGRYHSPFQYGRVRNKISDHDLEIKTPAIIENHRLVNFKEILLELFNNEACHGSGDLHASYCLIDFEAAYYTAIKMQTLSPIRYGPFLPNGTNCSRFVNSVILSGKPNVINRLLLFSPKTLSPTPFGNVRSLQNYTIVNEISNYITAVRVKTVKNKTFKSEAINSIS